MTYRDKYDKKGRIIATSWRDLLLVEPALVAIISST